MTRTKAPRMLLAVGGVVSGTMVLGTGLGARRYRLGGTDWLLYCKQNLQTRRRTTGPPLALLPKSTHNGTQRLQGLVLFDNNKLRTDL